MTVDNFKRVLVVAPHTDDAEIACGGTISRFLREGLSVTVIALSAAAVEGTDKNLPVEEFFSAMNKLGVPKENVVLFHFQVRNLDKSRQDILDVLIQMKREYDPDLVFLPSPEDMHQDHQVAYNEGLRAFKDITIFGYEYPWNLTTFHTTCFVKLEEADVENKIRALAEYRSQDHKGYLNPDVVRAWAMTRGIAIKTLYAESFEVIRLMI